MLKIIAFIIALIIALPANAQTETPKKIIDLPVPYVSEVPDGKWVGPWKNACEEASITMMNAYYLGIPSLSSSHSKKAMLQLFTWQNKNFGYNADTTASETAKIINEYTSADATVKTNPTLEEIKKELAEGRPVITFHYGYDLKNPLIPFRVGGSYYHVMILKGYDENTEEFIVQDSGNEKSGENFRYSSSTIMTSLRDYNRKTKKASGSPVVLFTMLKQLVHAPGDPRLYLIRDNKKYYIDSMDVFTNHNWARGIIKTMAAEKLEAMPLSGTIKK